jgi:PLP dependent protein
LKTNLTRIANRIHDAATSCGRDPKSIRLVAVSKTKPAEQVIEAVEAGLTLIGESYIQEARDKTNALSALNISWHFIGHLQSNKAKYAVRLFDLIHSVDSYKLARELNKQAEKIAKVQDILIQVNISKEATKSGIASEETEQLIRNVSGLSHVRMMGLMTVPPFFNAPEKARPYFKSLRNLRDKIQQTNISNVHLKELSMGMSGDYEVAIEEGATLVRIGTAIFGSRQ